MIYRKQKRQDKGKKSVGPVCGIHHLSNPFEQYDQLETLNAFRMRTVNIKSHYSMQRLCQTSENSANFRQGTKGGSEKQRVRFFHFNF